MQQVVSQRDGQNYRADQHDRLGNPQLSLVLPLADVLEFIGKPDKFAGEPDKIPRHCGPDCETPDVDDPARARANSVQHDRDPDVTAPVQSIGEGEEAGGAIA